MLQKIKDRAKGWISKTILILISLSFVLWGTSSIWNIFLAENVLIDINGELYSPLFFENAVSNYKEGLTRTNLGRQTASERFAEIEIREQVLEGIINATLLRQAATEDALLLSNKQIDEIIVAQAAFHVDGKFSTASYNAFLQRSRTTSSAYKEYINNNYKLNTYGVSIENTGFFVPSELDIYANLNHRQFNYQYLALDPKDFTSTDPVDEAVLRAFYEERIEDYYLPPEYTIRYYVLSPDDLLDSIEITDQELQDAYFNTYGSRLADANVTLRQIFYADEEGINLGLESEAEELKEQISNKDDFIRLAGEVSQDEISKGQGGSIGESVIADLPTAFVDAIGRADRRQSLIGPVRTNLGVHLLWVDEWPDVEIPNLSDVQEDLLVDLRYAKVDEETLLKAESFSYEILTLNDLDEAAANLDITGGADATFTIGDEFALEYGEVLTEEVLVMNEGDTSDVLFLDNGNYMAIALTEKKDERLQQFVDIREQIEADYKLFESTERIAQVAKDIVENIETGKQTYAEALALIPNSQSKSRRSFRWQEFSGHSRSSEDSLPGENLVFNLHGKGTFPYGTSGSAADGKIEIVLISAIINKNYADLSPTEKLIVRGEYLDNSRVALNGLVIKSLRDRADIEIDEDLAGVR